jgi:hypothetical protein
MWITYFNSHFCLLRCSYHIYRAELRKRIITPTLGYSFFNKYSGALAPFFFEKNGSFLPQRVIFMYLYLLLGARGTLLAESFSVSLL